MPLSEVFFGDCMDYMHGLPDKSFDLAVCDPPYFSGPERRKFYGNKESKIGVLRFYEPSAEWQVPGDEYFREVIRVSRHYIIFGCNYYKFTFSPGRIVWDKVNGASSFSDCEIAATNLFDSVRLFRYMWNGMMQGESVEHGDRMQGNKLLNENRIHPTQKPKALYYWLFKNFAPPGTRILDTHLGSGSSRITAYKMGYNFCGCEKDRHYFDAQEKRFQKEVFGIEEINGKIIQQLTLF